MVAFVAVAAAFLAQQRRAAEPLLILYATESGNAEGVAVKLAASARRQT